MYFTHTQGCALLIAGAFNDTNKPIILQYQIMTNWYCHPETCKDCEIKPLETVKHYCSIRRSTNVIVRTTYHINKLGNETTF
jgi:hypothetical protein